MTMYNTKKGQSAIKSNEWNKFLKSRRREISNQKDSLIPKLEKGLKSRGATYIDDELIINANVDRIELSEFIIHFFKCCKITEERLVLFDLLIQLKYEKTAEMLINEFLNYDYDRWAIGDFLYATANVKYINRYIEIAQNKSYGTSRQMVILIFGKLKYYPSINLLIELLNDEDVFGHALNSLSKIASQDYCSYFVPFVDCKYKWVSKIANRFLKKYDSKK